jgi:Thioredoxin-like
VAISILAALALAAPTATVASPSLVHATKTHDHYSTIAFDPKADAQAQLEAKLISAATSGKKLLIIMGANWCHDSAALANLLGSPAFVGMISRHYEVLYVDVGVPQGGRGRNLDIAARFGISKVKGTPTVLIVSSEGQLLNSRKDALSWRNAASRNADKVYRTFAKYAGSE